MSAPLNSLLKKLPGIAGVVSASVLLGLPVLAQVELEPTAGRTSTEVAQTSSPGMNNPSSAPIPDQLPDDTNDSAVPGDSLDPSNDPLDNTQATPRLEEGQNSGMAASEIELSPEGFEILCQRFPLNSRCEGSENATQNRPRREVDALEPGMNTQPGMGTQNGAPIPDQLPDDTNDSAVPGDSLDPTNDPFNNTPDAPRLEEGNPNQ